MEVSTLVVSVAKRERKRRQKNSQNSVSILFLNIMTASTAIKSCTTRDDDCKARSTNTNTEPASISIKKNDSFSDDHIVYLTLGDGDFTYSLDLVRYFTSSTLSTSVPRRPLKLVLSGIDSFETLTSKYKDTPHILEEIRNQQEKMPSLLVSIRHGVNAIVHKNSSHKNVDVVVDGTVKDECTSCTAAAPVPPVSIEAADHVLFQHPHLGTENCSLHKRFLAHLFHSATNHWMKRNGGIFHLTLVEGQYDRWECKEQAKRHGLILLHQAPFAPPPISYQSVQQQDSKNNDDILNNSNSTNDNVDLNCNRYHYRRHQTGKSFASRRPKCTSITYTFGRTADKNMYVATTLPWQQSDCSSQYTNTAEETGTKSSSITKTQTTSKSTSTLLCPFCDKEFLEERSRKCHIRDKHPNEEVPSDDRSKQPRKKRQKKEETFISTPGDDGSSLFCPHCQDNNTSDEESSRRIFQSAKALETHIRAKHSAIYTYIAPDWSIVKQKEKNNNNDTNHDTQTNNHDNDDSNVVDNKSKVEECHICGLKLVGRSFTQHLQDFVPLEGSETFSCQFCSKSFREERAKLQHMNFCGKRPISN
ncbi:MAG: hypothetical protein ACI8RD_012833 [Bacillariaceae sp.]|jgi:hypothetical protein